MKKHDWKDIFMATLIGLFAGKTLFGKRRVSHIGNLLFIIEMFLPIILLILIFKLMGWI